MNLLVDEFWVLHRLLTMACLFWELCNVSGSCSTVQRYGLGCCCWEEKHGDPFYFAGWRYLDICLLGCSPHTPCGSWMEISVWQSRPSPGGCVHLHHQAHPPIPSYSSSLVACVPVVMWQHSTIFFPFDWAVNKITIYSISKSSTKYRGQAEDTCQLLSWTMREACM
jgi:hypothetical protein